MMEAFVNVQQSSCKDMITAFKLSTCLLQFSSLQPFMPWCSSIDLNIML